MSRPISGFQPGGIGGGDSGQPFVPPSLIIPTPPTPVPIPGGQILVTVPSAATVSRTKILNEALSALGYTVFVENMDTEDSVPAKLAKEIFDTEVEYTLREFDWPFASTYAKPGLVAGSETQRANGQWTYAYQYPSDCAKLREIVSPLGRRTTNRIPYVLGSGASGTLIYTDLAPLEIRYTARIADPERWDALFRVGVKFRLAVNLTPALSRIANIVAVDMQLYARELDIAKRAALNEEQRDPDPEVSWLQARD